MVLHLSESEVDNMLHHSSKLQDCVVYARQEGNLKARMCPEFNCSIREGGHFKCLVWKLCALAYCHWIDIMSSRTTGSV